MTPISGLIPDIYILKIYIYVYIYKKKKKKKKEKRKKNICYKEIIIITINNN